MIVKLSVRFFRKSGPSCTVCAFKHCRPQYGFHQLHVKFVIFVGVFGDGEAGGGKTYPI